MTIFIAIREAVLPCPFCGSGMVGELYDAGPSDEYSGSSRIGCDDCKCSAPTVEAWNARVNPWRLLSGAEDG